MGWLAKSVEPGEGTKKRWVHSLEVNENPERKPKSSDELIEDVLAALKNGEQFLKKGRSSTEGEVVTLSSDSDAEEENRKKKKKKKRMSENDESDDDRKEREKRKKKRREGSEEEERLRQIALNSLISEHSREERSSATLVEDAEEVKEEVECEDIGEDVEAEVNNLAAEV